MGTSCASGKWCENGNCIANNLAPIGSCLTDDNNELCNDYKRNFGMKNTCLNFESTQCCEMCGGAPLRRLSNHSIENWLSNAKLKNVEILVNQENAVLCENKYTWCDSVKRLKNDENLCANLVLVNNEVFRFVCKKACNLC